MNWQPPSRLALAVFDCFVVDNEPLKGDLLEEFESRRSQWWLWRQVIGAIVVQPRLCALTRDRTDLIVLAAVIVLLSFEAVFVTNLLHHLMYGPGIPSHEAYAFYRTRTASVEPAASEMIRTAFASMYAPVVAVAVSMPTAWLIGRFHQRHDALSRGAFASSVMVCTALGLEMPFGIQFLTTLAFIVGLLMSGCVAVAVDRRPAARIA